jgi:hypothetical protein
MVAHYAEPGTPDHDKMVLLDMVATGSDGPNAEPAEEKRN